MAATPGPAGARTRVSAPGQTAGASARLAGALSVTEIAHYTNSTAATATTTLTNTIKNQKTSPQLHSAARHVSGFLQVVPIETASERAFHRSPNVASEAVPIGR